MKTIFLLGLLFMGSFTAVHAATMTITSNPPVDVTVHFALGIQAPESGPVASSFTFQSAKGVIGPSTNPTSQTGFRNSSRNLFAVTVTPATKAAFTHIFLTAKGPHQIFVSDINERVSKLLPQPWRDAALGWVRVEKIVGRKITLQTIDFSHAPFQIHTFAVNVDMQGGITLAP